MKCEICITNHDKNLHCPKLFLKWWMFQSVILGNGKEQKGVS